MVASTPPPSPRSIPCFSPDPRHGLRSQQRAKKLAAVIQSLLRMCRCGSILRPRSSRGHAKTSKDPQRSQQRLYIHASQLVCSSLYYPSLIFCGYFIICMVAKSTLISCFMTKSRLPFITTRIEPYSLYIYVRTLATRRHAKTRSNCPVHYGILIIAYVQNRTFALPIESCFDRTDVSRRAYPIISPDPYLRGGTTDNQNIINSPTFVCPMTFRKAFLELSFLSSGRLGNRTIRSHRCRRNSR